MLACESAGLVIGIRTSTISNATGKRRLRVLILNIIYSHFFGNRDGNRIDCKLLLFDCKDECLGVLVHSQPSLHVPGLLRNEIAIREHFSYINR